jgi:hypothetical protein
MFNILNVITFGLYKGKCMKKGFFAKMVDKKDTSVALSSIIVIALMLVGILLLILPMFILIIEAWFNHTITTDLNGMAAYIGAVTAIFVTAGSIKVGIHWSDGKTERAKMELESNYECDAKPPFDEQIIDGD